MALLGKDPVNEYGADMRMLDLYLHDKDYTVSIEEGFDHQGVELRIQRYGKSDYHNKVMIGFEKIEQIDEFISMLQKAIGKEVEA
jgi:esterase/lipase